MPKYVDIDADDGCDVDEDVWSTGPVDWETAAEIWSAAISVAGPTFERAWRYVVIGGAAPEPQNGDELRGLALAVYDLALEVERDSIVSPRFLIMTTRALVWYTSVNTVLRLIGPGEWEVYIEGRHPERVRAAEIAWARRSPLPDWGIDDLSEAAARLRSRNSGQQ